MNKNFLIGIAAVAAAGYYFLMGKKQAIESLEIKPIDIAINKSKTNILRLVFQLKLKITNPANFAVKLNNIDVDVIVNNKIIGQFQKTLPVTIGSNKTEAIIIEISVGNLQVIDVIFNIIANGGKINAGISGIVGTDLGDINIEYFKTI